MKILASKARLYVDLLDAYETIFLSSLHQEFEGVLLRIVAKLCNHTDFEVKERSYSVLLMTILYNAFEHEGVFDRREISKSLFFEWAHTTRTTVKKWDSKLLGYGVSTSDYQVTRRDYSGPVLDFDVYAENIKREIDAYDANYEAIELLREMMDLPQGPEGSLEQVTLMSILERYPETEAGYAGVMVEVTQTLEDWAQKLEPQLTLAKGTSQFDIWYHWPARGYLRLLFDLVDFHKAIGYLELALEYGDALLEVLKQDQLGVRDLLIPTAIQLGDKDKALALMARFSEDDSASMHYNRALLSIAQKQEGHENVIKEAIGANQYIPDYLFGTRTMPFEGDPLPDRFVPGDETEAMLYCYNALDAWHTVPGAISSLKQVVKRLKKETKVVAFRPRR